MGETFTQVALAAVDTALTTVVPMMAMAGAGSMMAGAMTNVESALAVGALSISQGVKVLGSIRGGNPSSVNDNGQQQDTLVERKESYLQDEEVIKILKRWLHFSLLLLF